MTANAADPAVWASMRAFAPIFAGGHYLTFLNLKPPVDEAVQAMKTIIADGPPDLEADVVALLDPVLAGWRPQLVAAAAMIAGAGTPPTLGALWRALEQPSWVSPQLAATAFIVDPDFRDRARARIEVSCRVDTSRIRAERGWNVQDFNDSKQMNALVALLEESDTPDWLAAAKATPEAVALLAADRHDGADIAVYWAPRARALLREA